MEPPWAYWSRLSHKAEAFDLINQGCNHSFYRIPFTINHLLNSKISIPVHCEHKICKAVDQFLMEKDIFLYLKVFYS